MTLQQCIGRVDEMMHNTCSDHQKILWLSALDGQIQQQIIDTHEGSGAPFVPYESSDGDRTLLAQPPFDQMYLHYLQAQIHYQNGELNRYNNAIALFQAAFDAYANHYNRTHRPLGSKIRYF